MSNYMEYNDKIAFHPGYFIKEIVDESGLTQEDFAKKLGTTPKNLSKLITGKQNLTRDMALKLSRMLGTSVEYWLNFQKKYDSLIAEFESDKELVDEREVFKYIDYNYFKCNFCLPDLSRKTDEQIKQVREFLRLSSLTVLKNRNLSVNFRSSTADPSISNIINSNIMVQIAINYTLKTPAPKYNRDKFEKAIDYALTLTKDHQTFLSLIKEAFKDAGVVLLVLPNLKGSGTNGATKVIGDNMMLMVNDRWAYSDTFWFTLLHEAGHIMNGDYGITFDKSNQEDAADTFARDALIPPAQYITFVKAGDYSKNAICTFAEKISRDPGIVLGRLQNDGLVPYTNTSLSKALRHNYQVVLN